MLFSNKGCLLFVCLCFLMMSMVSAQVIPNVEYDTTSNLRLDHYAGGADQPISVLKHSRLIHPSVNQYDRFGQTVDMCETYMVVGASGNDTYGAEAGTVYVFRYDTDRWVADGQLFAEDARSYSQFGRSVAVTEDYIAIAALDPQKQNKVGGVVYIFERGDNGWQQAARLTALDALLAEDFGSSLAINDNLVLIGAKKDSENGKDAGAAYLFEKMNGSWKESVKLIASNGDSGDRFGSSVGLSEEFLVVGAPNARADGLQKRSGLVYVFHKDRSGWYEHSRLSTNTDAPVAGNKFGGALAMDGNIAIVGAAGGDKQGEDESSAAYIFQRKDNEWRQIAELMPDDAIQASCFGSAVDVRNGFAAVGAPARDGEIDKEGAVYLFRGNKTDWQQVACLKSGKEVYTEALGVDVALNEQTLAAGVSIDHQNTISETGAVWVFADVVASMFADSTGETSQDSRVRVRESNSIPQATFLASGVPQLASQSASIRYGLSNEGWVSLKILDASGQEIRTLVESEQPPGIRSVFWDGRDASGRSVADGIYVSRLETDSVIKTQEIIVGRR